MSASSRKSAEVTARRARVLELRAQGWTFQKIADDVGLPSASAAVTDVTRALEARKSVSDGQMALTRAMEDARIDALERRLQEVLEEVADDPDMVLKTADRLIRNAGRRTRLHGLDRRVPEQPAREADGIDQLAARRAARRAG